MARFSSPQGGVAAHSFGDVYVADYGNNRIRKIAISNTGVVGAVTTFAGTAGTAGLADGTGTAATFSSPQDVAVVGTNLYVADKDNHAIRKIVVATQIVDTLAGNAANTPGVTPPTTAGFANGAGTEARFNAPSGVAADSDGNLYVADKDNHAIRKIVVANDGLATVTTLANNKRGFTDDTDAAAQFFFPEGVAVFGTGNASRIYVADTVSHTIRKIEYK